MLGHTVASLAILDPSLLFCIEDLKIPTQHLHLHMERGLVNWDALDHLSMDCPHISRIAP